MIKDRARASAVAQAAEALITQLLRSAETAPDGTFAATSEAERRRLVQLIGKIESELLGPLYKQYPNIEPDSPRKKPRP
jgi:hypothetical protein